MTASTSIKVHKAARLCSSFSQTVIAQLPVTNYQKHYSRSGESWVCLPTQVPGRIQGLVARPADMYSRKCENFSVFVV